MSKLNLRESISPMLAQEWDNLFQASITPDFEQDTVINTLQELLNSLKKCFAKRVEHTFKKLSGLQVPSSNGFNELMTITGLNTEPGLSQTKLSIIVELRVLLNELMGRESFDARSTDKNIEALFNEDVRWHAMDGGTLRLRPTKDGSMDVIIHPDLALRLNRKLVALYPNSIFTLINKTSIVAPVNNVISPSVIDLITQGVHFDPAHKTIDLRTDMHGEVARRVHHIIEQMGGIYNDHSYQFDFDPRDLFRRLAISGVMPETTSQAI